MRLLFLDKIYPHYEDVFQKNEGFKHGCIYKIIHKWIFVYHKRMFENVRNENKVVKWMKKYFLKTNFLTNDCEFNIIFIVNF